MAKGLFKKSNILIAITAFLISLIFVEVILRVFFIKDFEPIHYLFFTKPALQDQEKTFGFKENADIREVAVHWNGKKFEIVYDTSFSTNNIGLVQKNSFDPKKEAIVLVGDSFTQGEGAIPWFYKLEENWQNSRYQLINLGIMGTGIEQWKYMLSWFSELGHIKHIFICFITDDWNRRRCIIRDNSDSTGFNFIPWSQRNQIVNNLTIYYIDKDISNEALLRKAEMIRNNDLKFSFKKSIKSYRIISSIFNRRIFDIKFDGIFNNNKLMFKQIISDYGNRNVSLFHIPERGEAIQGTYSPFGQKIKDFILSQDIAYIDGLALCGLNSNDFHEQDGHPNASGYNKIFNSFFNHALNTLYFQNKP